MFIDVDDIEDVNFKVSMVEQAWDLWDEELHDLHDLAFNNNFFLIASADSGDTLTLKDEAIAILNGQNFIEVFAREPGYQFLSPQFAFNNTGELVIQELCGRDPEALPEPESFLNPEDIRLLAKMHLIAQKVISGLRYVHSTRSSLTIH